jgi:hypothetical protein
MLFHCLPADLDRDSPALHAHLLAAGADPTSETVTKVGYFTWLIYTCNRDPDCITVSSSFSVMNA